MMCPLYWFSHRILRFFNRIALAAVFGLALSNASAQELEFRFYRFTPTELRDGFSANSVQLADIEFYANDALVPAESAENPDGANPSSETPEMAIDGSLETKWLDFNRGPLIVDLGAPVRIEQYRWATANDALERDPIRWILEGSVDLSNWTLLDDRSAEDFETPLQRFTFIPLLLLSELPEPSSILYFDAIAGNARSGEGIALPGPGEVVFEWSVENADRVNIEPGVGGGLPPQGNRTLTVGETTTFRLSLPGGENSDFAEVTVYIAPNELPLRLNELLASATRDGAALLDEDGEAEDWIEIHNPNPFAVPLGGYHLTDDPALPAQWTFPESALIQPDEYLIVFASSKDRAEAGHEWHANFSLAIEGEYLGLIRPDGVTPLDEFAPSYPEQAADISYGRVGDDPSETLDFFVEPTPGQSNSTQGGLPLIDFVEFSRPGGPFQGSVSVELSAPVANVEIRYTRDGSLPGENSTRYGGSAVSMTQTTQIRARLFRSGSAPGPVSSQTYIKLNSSAATFESNLPVIVLDNYDRGSVPNSEPLQEHYLMLFEPGEQGTTRLTGAPAAQNRIGIKRRGSSTLGDPKGNYRMEFWDEENEDFEVRLLDLSSHADWILFAPYRFDRSLLRIPFIHNLSNDIGQYASKSRFVELFLNTGGGELSLNDYEGVYVLQEQISRGPERVDVARLDETDLEEPDITGGYILSIDRPDANTVPFRTSRGTPTLPPQGTPRPWFNHVYPKDDSILPQQVDYIKGFLDEFEDALYGTNFTDPETGYAPFIDRAAFVEHHILAVLTKDPDALRLSTFLYKDKEGPLAMGPIWDFDRTMGNDSDGRSADPAGWDPAPENAGFFTYDWWGRLFEDPNFWQAWIDRWQGLRLHEISNDELAERVEGLAAQVAPVQERNFDRWPEVSPNGGAFSNLPGWPGEVEHLKNWLILRSEWIDSQFPQRPAFNIEDVVVEPGASLILSSPGNQVYYTTDGADPRGGGGGVADGAFLFEGGSISIHLVPENAGYSYLVPSVNESKLNADWTQIDFNDASWTSAAGGLGYDNSAEYEPWIDTDVNDALNGVNTSVYVRIPFELDAANALETLDLHVRYDDGFAAYLNGTLVAQANAPGSPLTWDSQASSSHSDSEAVVYEVFSLQSELNLLQAGGNVLALHGLNQSLNSSDFLLEAMLTGTMTQSSQPIVINETTRVTARAFDGSQWSSPADRTFLVGTPADASNLAVTEIHYHPSEPTEAEEAAGFLERKDFEFVELTNIGGAAIELSGVRFIEGVFFEFTPATSGVLQLAPGQSVLLANNRAAFEFRYAERLDEIAVAGEFTGNLNNGGEQILLLAADGSQIANFIFEDEAPWPALADGEGLSLVLKNPGAVTRPDPNDPSNWRASVDKDGNPGGSDALLFEGDPLADTDGNGWPDFRDYAFGAEQERPPGTPAYQPGVQTFEIDGAMREMFTLDVVKRLNADQARIELETSSDLMQWKPLTETMDIQSAAPLPGGFVHIIYAGRAPAASMASQYIRIKLTRQ